jgi:TonB family protein
MKKLRTLGTLAITIFLFSLTNFAQNYTSETDNFRVWFPSTPDAESSVSNSGLEVRKYIAESGDILAEVSVIDLNHVKYTSQVKTQIYNGLRDGAVQTMRAKLLLDKSIIISGQSGRSFKFSAATLNFYQRLFIKDFKLYQITINTKDKSTETATVKKFFDSFRLIEKINKKAKVSKDTSGGKYGNPNSHFETHKEKLPPLSGIGTGRGMGGGGSKSSSQVESTEDATPKVELPKSKDSPLKITGEPRAIMTDAARKNAIQGTVTLKVTFLSNGAIGNISVVSGLKDGLNDSAIAAAKNIKFIPERKNGVPITIAKKVQYSFTVY